MINYYRFCCRIRIADEYADEVPGGEFLAVEDGDAKDRREQFADSRVNEISDWFHQSPALLSHIRALQTGRDPDIRKRWVDTEVAQMLTGRSRQDLYRLADEGLLADYYRFYRGRRRRMWDPLDLDNVPPLRVYRKKFASGG
jgi:hypothetical protein